MSEESKVKVTETSYYEDLDHIIEIVFDQDLVPEVQFAIYDKISKQITYCPELKFEDGTILKPSQLDLIKQKKILLPSYACEFSDEARLLEEIEAFIKFYLDLPHPFYLKLVSHYVLLTWVYDKLSVVPYLRALGDYGSGKTRFAQVIGSICYKPLFLAGATSDAFIFRMIELFKGTVVINELERVNTDLQSQIVNILNNGYEKGLYVGRVEGDKKREPKVFDVFSPKIITSRSKFKDLALESRILSIPMKQTRRKDIPSSLDLSFWDSALELRNKLLYYRFRNLNLPDFDDRSSRLTEVEPRLRQTLLPIFSVIQSESVEEEFIKYTKEFQEQIYSDRSFETEALVAEKLVELLEGNQKVNVKDVTEKINGELEDKAKLTSKSVGNKIRSLGFKTKRIQGVYQIIPNQPAIVYIKERYRIDNQTDIEQSPPNPPSPLPDSNLQGDLVDKVDSKNKDEQLALGKAIFGKETEWADEEGQDEKNSPS